MTQFPVGNVMQKLGLLDINYTIGIVNLKHAVSIELAV